MAVPNLLNNNSREKVWDPTVYNADIAKRKAASKAYGKIATERLNKVKLDEQARELQDNAGEPIEITLGGKQVTMRARPLATGRAAPVGEAIAPYTPGVGDALMAADAINDAKHGDYSSAAVTAGLMMLPFGIGKYAKRGLRALKKPVGEAIDAGVTHTFTGKVLSGRGAASTADATKGMTAYSVKRPLEKVVTHPMARGKKFGQSFEELATDGILEKDLKKGALEDLGIGIFRANGVIQYDNGLQMRKYLNPSTKEDDVFMIFNPKTEENIAYMRSKSIGSDMNVSYKNEFHIKADMPNSSKEEVKFAMEELKKVLPKKHKIYERTNMSLDGVKVWNQQLKHGYEPTGESLKVPINVADKRGLMKKLNTKEVDYDFSDAVFKNKDEANVALSRVKEELSGHGINYDLSISSDNKIMIDAPVLRRLFGVAGAIALSKEVMDKLKAAGSEIK